MSEHRAIVVGAGVRGRAWCGALREHPRWELAGVADIDDSSAGRQAAAMEVPGFSSLEAALQGVSDIEGVIVATPHDHHAAVVRTALDHGRAVLCEKPFTDSLASAVELVELSDAKGIPVVVGQNYRYLRSHRAIKQVVQGGELGNVVLVVMHYYRPWKDVEPQLMQMDNCIVWGIGPHHIDSLRYLFDSEIASVHARLSTAAGTGRPPGCTITAALALENGAQVNYSSTYESAGQDRFEGGREFYMRIVGDEATLHVFNRWLVLARPGKLPRVVRRGPRTTTEEAYLLDQLAGAVTGTAPESSARDNLGTMAGLEACVRSSDETRAIDPREILRDALGR